MVGKRQRIFKMIILFLLIVFLIGCSEKHVLRREEELSERNVVSLWRELECGSVNHDKQGFSLGVRVRDCEVVRKRLRLKEVYKYSSGDEEENSFLVLGGLVLGCAGCFFGYKIGVESDEDYVPSLLFPSPSEQGCIAACLLALPGCLLMGKECGKGREYSKFVPDFIQIDTVCVRSMILLKQKMKVTVENSDFEKIYYTDKDGDLELRFDEIIPEPTEADSTINLIIQYGEMIDTVDVKMGEMED